MKTLAAALLLVLAGPAASAAELAVVTSFDEMLLSQVYFSPREEAFALVANSTVLGKVGAMDVGLAEKLPFGADVVLFLAENGDLLAWSDKSEVIEAGYWELIGGAAFSELCVRFGAFGLNSLCSSPEIDGSDWLIETTPGNPFGLAAGAAVPLVLGDGPHALSTIAARLP